MNEDAIPQTLYAGRHPTLLARGRWEYVTRNTRRPGVGVVAITDDRRLVLVEQFRHAIQRAVVEIPAGLAGDVAGLEDEPLLSAAQRELLEETGYVAERWRELYCGYSSPGLTDESIVLFLAEGLKKVGAGGGDGSENIVIHEVPLNDIITWLAKRDQAVDLKLLAGLFAAMKAR